MKMQMVMVMLLSYTDDWSQLPGNTLSRFLSFGDIPSASMGDGSIFVTGDGTTFRCERRL